MKTIRYIYYFLSPTQWVFKSKILCLFATSEMVHLERTWMAAPWYGCTSEGLLRCSGMCAALMAVCRSSYAMRRRRCAHTTTNLLLILGSSNARRVYTRVHYHIIPCVRCMAFPPSGLIARVCVCVCVIVRDTCE